MSRWWTAAGLVVVAIAALMLVPAFASVGTPTMELVPVGGSPAAHLSADAATSADSALVAKALSTSKADHIPLSDVFLPNVHGVPQVSNGVVQPLYTSAPAPMGVGYWGVQKSHGVDVGTISYYRSVEASVTLNSVDPLYLASSSPDIFTMQLNTVLTHTTVLGNTTGQYWIQNVPVYEAASQTLSIEDNIWNFSSNGAGMQVGTLHSYSGNLVPGVFYYAVGPTWHMPTPFTVTLYNNATISNDRPTVYFNYTITSATGTVISGSYDKVEFNSAAHPTHRAAPAAFQVNGKQYNAFGLLNDAEIMLGGPGGGSTTSLFGLNATMGLWTLANGSSTYAPVPAASSFGTDTGETSEGIAEWTNGGASPIAYLGVGPSLLQPLWGLVGAASGHITASFALSPSNAFAFANQGHAFTVNTAEWAPTPAHGAATYWLSPHTYTFEFLLADHNAQTVTVSGSGSVTVHLSANASVGIDTPLWAWDAGQLAAISSGGTGTIHDPFTLDNNGPGLVSPLFGEFNDYYYPVFPGVFLANTNVYVTASALPDFNVVYSLPAEAAASARFGTPYTNNLDLQFYNDTHIALAHTQVTGWTFSQDSYISSLLFWNTTDSLIVGNDFQVQSIGAMLSGGTGNWLWGNEFTPATTTAANPGEVLYSGGQLGLEEFNTGDTIANNAFTTAAPAYTPPFNLYTGAPQTPVDTWNLTHQPSTVVHHVNGWNLSGSVLGLPYVAGNYWSNYGTPADPYGVLPYDDGGLILVGGDFAPVLPYPLHRIVVTESGLTAGTAWTITIDGYAQTSTTTSMTFWEPSGTYAYVVTPVSGYTATPASGAVTLGVNPQMVTITFT
jgi:thermopsin